MSWKDTTKNTGVAMSNPKIWSLAAWIMTREKMN